MKPTNLDPKPLSTPQQIEITTKSYTALVGHDPFTVAECGRLLHTDENKVGRLLVESGVLGVKLGSWKNARVPAVRLAELIVRGGVPLSLKKAGE